MTFLCLYNYRSITIIELLKCIKIIRLLDTLRFLYDGVRCGHFGDTSFRLHDSRETPASPIYFWSGVYKIVRVDFFVFYVQQLLGSECPPKVLFKLHNDFVHFSPKFKKSKE